MIRADQVAGIAVPSSPLPAGWRQVVSNAKVMINGTQALIYERFPSLHGVVVSNGYVKQGGRWVVSN